MSANIFCCVPGCAARPFPLPKSGVRQDFELMKLDADGRPAEGGAGKWYWSRHFRRLGRPGAYRIIVEETEIAAE